MRGNIMLGMNNEKERNVKNIAVYSRKSKYTGKGESIGNQIEMCRDYLRSNYREEFDNFNIDVYEDEGYSGGNTNRPHFQEMLKNIKARKYDTVICYRLDRISRNTADFSNLINVFEKLNVSFISIKDRFDTTTSTGKAMMLMVSVFAQLERDTIAERIRDNMHELAKTGRWLGGTTPTGYKSKKLEDIKLDGKKKSSFKLELIEDEIEIVKLIYKKFIETNSLTKTESFLLKEGIKTKNDKEYTRFSIRSILENPVYMIADIEAWKYFDNLNVDIYSDKSEFNGKNGIMAYNKTKQISGMANKKNEIDDWIIAIGKHKGVISGNDWVKVQRMLNQNKSKAFRKPKSHIALLSGVLVCGECGKFMRPKQTNRFNKDGEKVFHYLCETKEKSQKQLCSMKNINGNALDKAVCEEIKKLSYDDSTFINQLKKARKSILNNSKDYTKEIKEKEILITNNEKAIQNYIKALSDNKSKVSINYINDEIEKLHNENEALKSKIEDIKCLIKDYSLSDSDIEIMKETLLSFSKSVDMMTIEEKRNAIRMLIKKVVWDGENVHIYFFGSDCENENLPIITETDDDEMLPLCKDSK